MDPVVNINHGPFHLWEKSDVVIRRDQSFLRFILPVAFPELNDSYRFEHRAEQLDATGYWQLLGGEKQGFLPHVRIHFNSVRWHGAGAIAPSGQMLEIGRASCRERV